MHLRDMMPFILTGINVLLILLFLFVSGSDYSELGQLVYLVPIIALLTIIYIAITKTKKTIPIRTIQVISWVLVISPLLCFIIGLFYFA